MARNTCRLLTRDEVRAVLERLDGVPSVMALLLYGAALRLRVQDVDFATKDRVGL